MYALVENNEITQYFNYPKGFILNDNQYSKDIFTKWTNEELEAIGIYEIITNNSNLKDDEYYINTNEQYSFANGQVTKSWGTATARSLVDVNAVDDDGNAILDEDGNQVVIEGLKTLKKEIIKSEASRLLAPTDWYVVKASEVTSYSVPSNITTFRANVRTKSNEMETAIDNCTTVDALKTLYEYTEQEDGSITRPLGEFPKEVV